ncbi:hypothetical protein H2O64_12255 [Kordia sp. YSTF-M3]|uniref:Uncharacterized protein n=1 Tax=Kordia aestuariivivens TaxID=2759037 RepID=A0ABR7QA49_9FLAO|nr:hypothetical protein [Kordia aestuariivivens]MBC8755441.1 hypothetical protein [Kordia aestuariivivens]
MRQDVLQKFFYRTEDSGRFLVTSKRTGVTYFVEPIDAGKPAILWGDLDPVTKKMTGDYGNVRRGAVLAKESLITEANGFQNISTFKGSPLGEIDRRDRLYKNKL